MAYGTSAYSNLWDVYRQKRAGSGRALSPQEMSGIVAPMLDNQARIAMASGEREAEQSRYETELAMRRDAVAKQDRAARMSGIGQMAQTAGSLYLANDANNISAAKNASDAAYQSRAIDILGNRVAGAPSSLSGVYGAAPTTTVAPTTASFAAPYSVDGAISTGAANAGTVAPSVAPAATTTTGASLATTGGAQAAPTFYASTVSPALGPAALAGGIGSYLGGTKEFQKMTGMNEDIGQAAGGVVAGALAGAAATSWSGPGAIVGGIVGGLISLVDDIF